MREEVADQLRRRVVVAAAEREGLRFPVPLEGDAGQRAAAGIELGVVLRRDADHDAGVGVALVARVLAHAVGDHAAGLGGRGDHGAARAHAEAVDRAPVAGVVHQLVVGRAEQRVAGLRAEARAVDQRLRVLDAEADRERLGFDEHAARVQHAEGVARAVAERQHHVVGAHRSPSASTTPRTWRVAVGSISMCTSSTRCGKRISPPSASMVARMLFDHRHQAERADVRLADVEDFFRRAGLDELVQHLAAEWRLSLIWL